MTPALTEISNLEDLHEYLESLAAIDRLPETLVLPRNQYLTLLADFGDSNDQDPYFMIASGFGEWEVKVKPRPDVDSNVIQDVFGRVYH